MTDIETFCYENKPVPEVRIHFQSINLASIEVRWPNNLEYMTIPSTALAPIMEGVKAALEVLNANG